MFLITGHGRSGTLYTAKVLNHLGIPTGHENTASHNKAVVSWTHINEHREWDNIYLQLRDPLMCIASTMSIKGKSFDYMFKTIGKPKKDGGLFHSMYTWYHWNRWIEDNHEIKRIFRVEDLEREILQILRENGFGKMVSLASIRAIPKDTHTGGRKNKLSWLDLYNCDEELAMKIKAYAGIRGYK